MTGPTRAERDHALGDALARLVGGLTAEHDVLDLLDELTGRCVPLFAVRAAGLLLEDRRGVLHVVASSDERSELVDLLELQAEQGPCRDCVRLGVPVAASDLDDPGLGRRWPRFAARALADGVRAVHAVPMRLTSRTVGALNLIGAEARVLGPDELRAAQALADAATIGIVSERTVRSETAVVDQLRDTIAARVVVEQAKGVLAELGGLDVAEAFARLREHAHDTGERLSDLAHRVLDGTLDPAVVLDGEAPGASP